MFLPAVLCTFFLIGSPSLQRSFASWRSKVALSVVPVLLVSTQMAFAELAGDSPSSSQATEYVSLPSGVRYMDIRTGSGELSADEGRTVHFLWSLRQGNGYFVGSSNSADNEEIIYKVGNTKGTKVIAGLDEGIRGMKAGGIRRIDVPPKKGYTQGVAEGNPGPIPAGFGPRRQILTHAQRDTFHFEVKLTKIK